MFYPKQSIMQPQALLYSLDPKSTFTQMSDQENLLYDTNKYKKLDDWVSENNIKAMMFSEEEFHYKFFAIRPKVKIIYYCGDISLLNNKILGIVGPRSMSDYAKRVLESLFAEANGHDLVTISGMAEGVDQLCHKLSHDYKIPTIAVLWWWLGRYFRRQERAIIEQIVANGGLVISEYKLWEKPTKYTFPQRNRLIAWLSDVLFLPEAGEKSWSLVTVSCAIEMQKPVYATPSSIFSPTSAGILQLIENGYVKPIFNLPKFLSNYFPSKNNFSRPSSMVLLTDKEQLLLAALSCSESTGIQSILMGIGGEIQELVELLSMLEIKGLILQDCPGKYMLA